MEIIAAKKRGRLKDRSAIIYSKSPEVENEHNKVTARRERKRKVLIEFLP